MPNKSIKITRDQLNRLKDKFPSIGTPLKPTSEYELYRGKIEGTTLIVYDGKKGITLQLQNINKVVENIVEEILQIKETTLFSFSPTKEVNKERRRIIEIDDAGWGDLIGKVLIVGRDIKTDNSVIREISVSFFQTPSFEQKKYYEEAVRCVTEILNEFNAKPKDTFVHICTGDIFSKVYSFLEENGYPHEYSKITGKTQDLAENIFDKYLSGIGCPRGYEKMKKWLYDNYKERIKYAKTGWKEFNNPYEE